jgi:hypothetical protein
VTPEVWEDENAQILTENRWLLFIYQHLLTPGGPELGLK